MPLFGTKHADSFTVSVALKSSSIDLQLVRIPKSGPREVAFSERRIVLLENSQDPQLYTKRCVSELSHLLMTSAPEIQRLSGGRIRGTSVVLYAPWFTSHITSIAHKDDVAISERFLVGQLRTIKTPENLINLEKRIIKIMTNGYSVTELTESKLSNISMDVYSSYISRQIYDTLGATVAKNLPRCGKISYMTSPILMLNQIKSLLLHEDNVTFMFVGGEITEIGVIEDDTLSYFATFPIGKHDFLRELQGLAGTYDYDLLYQKEIQFKKKGQQEKFDTLKKQWSDMVVSTLASYKQNVPSKILILSDSKTRDFFVGLLSAQLKGRNDSFLEQNRIISFDMSALQDILVHKTLAQANELDMQLEALI